MRSILITGGSGFLGHGLARALLGRKLVQRVCIYSRNEWRQAHMRTEFQDDPRLRFFIGDVRDGERLYRAMRGVDTVIHAAALKRVEVGQYNATEMKKTNVDGTENVLYAAEDRQVERLIFVSSDKAFHPVNAYGKSKALAEELLLADRDMRGDLLPKITVCRYGNVAGSTGSVIPIWRQCLEQGRKARVTAPNATRFWMTRDEAVRLVLSAADAPNGSLLIPDLPAFRVADLAQAMGLDWETVGMGPTEKLHESMDDERCSSVARRMSVEELREALDAIAS